MRKRNRRTITIVITDTWTIRWGDDGSTRSKEEIGMQTQSIVGVWQVVIKVEGMATGFEGLYTFFADGNFLDINT
jgi:hypothetical protein